MVKSQDVGTSSTLNSSHEPPQFQSGCAVPEQSRGQTQNLGGGGDFFWENKISKVDFLHFYETDRLLPITSIKLKGVALQSSKSFFGSYRN